MSEKPAPPPSKKRPRGPIAWFRRRGLSLLARLSALAGILLILAWGAGRWFNDDHLWSQALFWIPTGVVASIAWITLVFSAVCSKLSLRMGGVKLRPFLAVGALVVTGWMVVSWKPVRLVIPAGGPSSEVVRVAYWNLSVERNAVGAGDVVLAQSPVIAILANVRADEHREPILKAMRSLIHEDEADEGVHFRHEHNITVSSRFPIRRWGVTRPKRVTTLLTEWRSEWDTGRITFIEFDTGGYLSLEDETFVVWVVDLPSDPTMSRAEVMSAAGEAVEVWEGPVMLPDALGRWIGTPLPEGERGFPEPDLIIGDFNTPRGSRSLRSLVGDARSTHAQAGVGPDATWMRRFPLWAIDQAFTGERVRATYSDVIDPGMSEHRMLVVEIEGR